MKLFSALKRLWHWLAGEERPYKTIFASELPDRMNPRAVYILGEEGREWFAAFTCPCGCKETIQLSILENTKPRWKLKKHPNGSVTLHPSVWRTKGCKSHFFFQQGNIKWVHDMLAVQE